MIGCWNGNFWQAGTVGLKRGSGVSFLRYFLKMLKVFEGEVFSIISIHPALIFM